MARVVDLMMAVVGGGGSGGGPAPPAPPAPPAATGFPQWCVLSSGFFPLTLARSPPFRPSAIEASPSWRDRGEAPRRRRAHCDLLARASRPASRQAHLLFDTTPLLADKCPPFFIRKQVGRPRGQRDAAALHELRHRGCVRGRVPGRAGAFRALLPRRGETSSPIQRPPPRSPARRVLENTKSTPPNKTKHRSSSSASSCASPSTAGPPRRSSTS